MRETKNHLVDAAANLNLKKNNSLNSKGRREFYSPGKSTTACDCYIYISGARGSNKSIETNCQGLSCPRIRENTGCSALHTSDLGLHLQNPLVPVSSCKVQLPVPQCLFPLLKAQQGDSRTLPSPTASSCPMHCFFWELTKRMGKKNSLNTLETQATSLSSLVFKNTYQEKPTLHKSKQAPS